MRPVLWPRSSSLSVSLSRPSGSRNQTSEYRAVSLQFLPPALTCPCRGSFTTVSVATALRESRRWPGSPSTFWTDVLSAATLSALEAAAKGHGVGQEVQSAQDGVFLRQRRLATAATEHHVSSQAVAASLKSALGRICLDRTQVPVCRGPPGPSSRGNTDAALIPSWGCRPRDL